MHGRRARCCHSARNRFERRRSFWRGPLHHADAQGLGSANQEKGRLNILTVLAVWPLLPVVNGNRRRCVVACAGSSVSVLRVPLWPPPLHSSTAQQRENAFLKSCADCYGNWAASARCRF